jgi:sulfate/thiosulfate transport system ATP-binding protein
MSIQVKNIYKNFGQFSALDNISIDFPSGSLVALLGPSGCGKTSLLRIIAGLDIPNQGEIWLDGQNCSDMHVKHRQVGFVFQHYALFKHMTVFENVAFGLKIKSKNQRLDDKAIEEKVHHLLNLVQLDWLGDRFPAQLSGGQRQRIALARALAVEPRVLLLDEPFGALDAKVRQDLRRWLRRLHNDLHITSIFVTHDQQEALEVADYIVLMQSGKIIQIGTPQELYAKPANAFVYEFLGGTNVFKGVIEGDYLKIDLYHNVRDKDNIKQDNHTKQMYLMPHHQKNTFNNGQQVKALSRPYELDIITDINQNDYGIPVQIKRIHQMGGVIQIELMHIATQHVFYCETHVHSEQIYKQFYVDMMVKIVASNLHIETI